MANGLFMTPAQVRQQENLNGLAMSQNPYAAVSGGMFNLGRNVSNAFTRGAFGVDTRSQQEVQAASLQQQMAGIDFTNPASVYQKAQELNNSGNTAAAIEVLKLVPQSAKPQDKWSQPYLSSFDVTDPDSGNITKQTVLLRKNLTNGKVERVSDLNSSGQVKDGSNNTGKFVPAKIDLDALDIDTQFGFLSNLPGIEGEGYLLDNYTVDEAKPILGDMERLATELKNRDKIAIHKQLKDDTELKTDAQYILEASQLMMEDPNAWYSQNSIGKGSKVKLRSNKRVTIKSLEAKRAKNAKIKAAKEAAGLVDSGREVRPNESKGVFSLSKLDRNQAFEAMVGKDPSKLVENLQSQGWNLTQTQQASLVPVSKAMAALPNYTREAILSGPEFIKEEMFKLNDQEMDQTTRIQKLIILNQIGQLR